MARSVNKVILVGYVGKHPEIKYTPSENRHGPKGPLEVTFNREKLLFVPRYTEMEPMGGGQE